MKFGIVVFPGSNCDRDMQNALQNDLKKEVIMLWHKDKDLSKFTRNDCIVLPGGLLPIWTQQFVCKNVFIKNGNGKPLKIPIAHGDGRYYAEEHILDELEANDQVIFRYCDEQGNIDIGFNPNSA